MDGTFTRYPGSTGNGDKKLGSNTSIVLYNNTQST